MLHYPVCGRIFVVIIIMLCIFIFRLPENAQAGENTHIGLVYVRPFKEDPKKCFKLSRDGKDIPIEYHTAVFSGDQVKVLPGEHHVFIHYFSVDSRDIEITGECNIPEDCPPSLQKTRDNTNPRLVTTKGPDSSTDCFPEAEELNVSLCPKNHTGILAGEPVLFRWLNLEEDSVCCGDVTLVIREKDKQKPLYQIGMKEGELKEVDRRFEAGREYEWFIAKDGNMISDKYFFNVLSEDDSAKIRNQLDRIAAARTAAPAAYIQANYLKSLHKANPKWNLFSDSLRYQKKYLEEKNKSERTQTSN